MKNPEQFAEFLQCCKEQHVKNIQLAEVCLLVNPSSGDFGSILIEFERDKYFISSKYLPHKQEDEEIDEFSVKKFASLDDLKAEDLTEEDLYKTISGREIPISFITEMIDADGYFNGIEWKYGDGYLFFIVCCPAIAVFASGNEELKYVNYPHQFGQGSDDFPEDNDYVDLFPGA